MSQNESIRQLQALKSQSLSYLVEKEIERLILSGKYLPGDPLREQEFVRELGVSRGPVREAFRSLEDCGLVSVEKNRGAFVRQIGLEEAMEVYDIRAALDYGVGYKVASSLTPEMSAALHAITTDMKSAVESGDVPSYHAANLLFHDRLVELTGNTKLILNYRKLVNELALFRKGNILEDKEHNLPASLAEHLEILSAIEAQDATRAARLLFDHALESKERAAARYQRERSR